MGKSKAKRPKDERIVYRFCENVNCNYHASSLEGERNELEAGKNCPKCSKGVIQELRLTQAAGTPVGPATAWALPAPPYGGFVLQLSDADTGEIWGGVANTDARHQGAHYVAELQRDLLRLAFYGPARGGETVGVFSKPLMAGVLDFKRHLVNEYGVGASTDFNVVRANAQTATKPQIYFPPQGLASPNEVYGAVNDWTKALGSPGGATGTLLKSVDTWTKLWEQTKAPERQDIEQDMTMSAAVVVMADYSRKRFVSGVKEEQTKRAALGTALVAQATARSTSSLDGAKVDKLVTDAETLVSLVNGLGADMPDALDGTKRTDAGLPPPSPSAIDPQPGPYTLTVAALVSSDINDRYDWTKAVHDQSGPIVIAQQSVSKFIEAKVREPQLANSFAQRFSRFEKDVRTRDELGALIEGLLSKMVEEASAATSAAAALNAQPPSGKPRGDLSYSRTNALNCTANWLKAAAPAAPPKPAIKPGPLDELNAKLSAKESVWGATSTPLPDNWAKVVDQAEQLKSEIGGFRGEIDKSQSTTIMDGYLSMLRDYGRVDAATARYIRTMVTDGKLEDRFIFRTPMGDELLPFSFPGDLPPIVASEAAASGLTGAPTRLVESVFRHETGGAHAQSFDKKGGVPFVKLGIDWDTPKDRSHFVDEKTSGRNLSFSRGWGISQTTLFTERGQQRREFQSAVPDPNNPGRLMAGPQRKFLTVSGVPMSEPGDSCPPIPLFIASGAEGARQGVRIFIAKFRATQKKRDCTYATRKYDCENCVKNLRTGTLLAGVTTGGMQHFDEASGDFERVVVNGRLASHKFRSVDRVRELVRKGNYSVSGKAVDTIDNGDTYEFPCSWLTAITLYAGVGQIAWYYALDRIHAIANGKG